MSRNVNPFSRISSSRPVDKDFSVQVEKSKPAKDDEPKTVAKKAKPIPKD